MTVLPAHRRPTACWTNVSLSGSSEAVASSSRMTGASLSRARAIERRWRSPPESAAPFSPSMVSKPSGSLSMNSVQHAVSAAARTSSSVASSRPMRMLPATVSSKSSTSWNTIETCDSHDSSRKPAMSRPSQVTRPPPGIQNRAASWAQVDLPEPDGPTSAVTCPSRAMKLTPCSTSFSS